MSLPSEGFAIYNIAHPTDPQVNGFGFYRTVDAGTDLLLDARIAIPDDNQYALTHDWEIFVAGVATNASKLQLHFTLDLGDYVLTAGTSAMRGTQKWEPGQASSVAAAGAYAPKDSDEYFQNSEDTGGYRGTYRWEIADGYVTTETFTWIYLTNTADTGLGASATTDNDLPPLANIAAVFDEHVFLSGNSTNPHRLFWSKRFQPEAYPTSYFIDIGQASDPIMDLAPTVGSLGVLCRTTKYYVNGDVTSGFISTESPDRRGTPVGTHARTPQGTAFIARDGIFLTTFVGKDVEISQKIFPLFIGETVNGESPINWDAISTASLGYYKQKLYFAYASGSNTQPDRVLVYSFTTGEWFMYDYVVRSMFFEETTDLLAAGSTDGIVYNLESGSQDGSSDIALDVQTKDFTDGNPSLRKLYLWFKLDADCQEETLTCKIYIDGTLQHTASITGSRTKVINPLPEDTWGHQWRANFTYTGNKAIKIYGITMEYLPLQSS